MNKIVRPLTEDGLFGYDARGQLLLLTLAEGGGIYHHSVADVRYKTCGICGHGWELNGPSIGDQLNWAVLDDHVHESCLVRFVSLRDRCTVFNLFRMYAHNTRTSNSHYWSDRDAWHKRLWYHIELKTHPYTFVIGHRKKVWSIQLTRQGVGAIDWWELAEKMFEQSSVTKEFRPDEILLHAWSDADLAHYVSQLLCLISEASIRPAK